MFFFSFVSILEERERDPQAAASSIYAARGCTVALATEPG